MTVFKERLLNIKWGLSNGYNCRSNCNFSITKYIWKYLKISPNETVYLYLKVYSQRYYATLPYPSSSDNKRLEPLGLIPEDSRTSRIGY